MKTAILHPWFLMRGGGEKVIDVLAGMYPEADIFALFVDPDQLSPILRARGVKPSILGSVPMSSRFHRHLMPLYPWAVESFDLSAYDLVLSSCGPAMMGASVRQDAMHICYCHTPQRSWWDLYSEHQAQLPPIFRQMFTIGAGWTRTWEFCAMQRVDHVVSNSKYIADRVSKYFRRESTVIYPPVSMGKGALSRAQGDYYLTLGRLEKQKRLDVVIEACNKLGRKLVVAGTGKEEAYLKSIAGPTIEFTGYVPDEAVAELYKNCRAFLFAAVEDFGIAPVEAQAYGKPVIAFGHGGSLETVRVNDGEGRPDTGVFFSQQTVKSLVEALRRFERAEFRFDPDAIREHASQFDVEAFTTALSKFVTQSGLFEAKESRCLMLQH
jgi:glycosyltransferase involved in cell wall biosynthesis